MSENLATLAAWAYSGNMSEISADLTPFQQAFCEQYLLDLNGTKAAIRAGYAEKGAHVEASRALSNPKVMDEINRLKRERAARTAVDADWLLVRLAEEANADAADLYDENGHLLPVAEWPLIWRQGLVAGIEVERLFAGRGEDRDQIGTITKIKLSDRTRRLELIGKHIGVQAFREQVGHTGLIGITAIDPAALTEDQLRALASIPTIAKAGD